MRLVAYAGTSALLAVGALLKAFNQRPNYYSATVYLSQSNACVLILANLALVCTYALVHGLQRLLYGPLRPVEIEQLSEKAWYAVLDTLLAMPSLRDDVGGWLLATFVLLLVGKVWTWIGEGRVDTLEQQPPQNPRLFHARLSTSLLLSTIFGASMFNYCLQTVLNNPRPGMMFIFTFEFAILTIFSLFTICRYGLVLVETRITKAQTADRIEERKEEIRAERARIQQEAGEGETPTLPSEDDIDENEIDVPGWEEKRRWLFGLELVTDFIKIIVYTVFFTISLAFIGLPMHIMRDVYLTFASFTKRLQDYNNYRKATSDMNTRYPDATVEELGNENTCIVCREVMIPWAPSDAAPAQPVQPNQPQRQRRPMNEGLRAKKLPCGHILHLRCLKAWLERQQACPTCRRPVVQTQAPTAPRGADNAAVHPGGAANQQGIAQDGHGNANANGANPARRPQARNRMRWLNMGPVRIGFYNGPANQVQDALRQQQQQHNQGQNQQQLPNGAALPSIGFGRNNAPTTVQEHLRAVELRLVREANELRIEQQELATVRALELELERLRIAHRAAGQAMPPQSQQFGSFGNNQIHQPQAFQPRPQQQPLRSGSSGLPEGLTLPDGWSLMPLHRVGPQMPTGVAPVSQVQPNGVSGFPPVIPQTMMAPSAPVPSTSQTAAANISAVPQDLSGTNGQVVPTRVDSSTAQHSSSATPTEEPRSAPQTAAETSTPRQISGAGDNATPTPPPPTTASIQAQEAPVAGPSSAPSPWTTSSWNFDDSAANRHDSTAVTASTVPPSQENYSARTNGAQAEESSAEETGSSSKGKGKGRAVEVEDADDQGN